MAVVNNSTCWTVNACPQPPAPLLMPKLNIKINKYRNLCLVVPLNLHFQPSFHCIHTSVLHSSRGSAAAVLGRGPLSSPWCAPVLSPPWCIFSSQHAHLFPPDSYTHGPSCMLSPVGNLVWQIPRCKWPQQPETPTEPQRKTPSTIRSYERDKI